MQVMILFLCPNNRAKCMCVTCVEYFLQIATKQRAVLIKYNEIMFSKVPNFASWSKFRMIPC